jgi:hypothetical protein
MEKSEVAQRGKSIVIHPILFAIFPALSLFVHNMDQFLVNETFIPIAITIGFTLLIWFLLGLIFKDKRRAALLVSLFLLLFFTYGRFFNAVWGYHFVVGGVFIGPNEIVLSLWVLLFLFSAYFSVKTHKNLHNYTNFLNVVAVSLIVISLLNGAYNLRTRVGGKIDLGPEDMGASPGDLGKPAALPNIYYIILDGYGREDVLKEIYQYDNAELLDYLTRKGFYVADKSRANYCQTSLSLASSLNLIYLDDLVNLVGAESIDRMPLTGMIRDNKTVNFLKQYGYLFVAFSSGYNYTEVNDADVYIVPQGSLTEFQNVLLGTTPLPMLLDKVSKGWQYNLHRNRLLYIFDHLADTAEMDSPVFVFAHIAAPHPPFVFREHGEPVETDKFFSFADGSRYMEIYNTNRDEYVGDYRRQLAFVSEKIKGTIDDIISRSDEPPIIILQADHGPGSMLDWENPGNTNFEERLSILNAYYLPDDGYKYLYEGITPVNTFRVILNHYFGTSYGLLQDKSYFSTWSRPYKFIEVGD